MTNSSQCLLLGAGISNLIIADWLEQNGLSYCLLEKSRGLGGRIAYRRYLDEEWALSASTYKIDLDKRKILSYLKGLSFKGNGEELHHPLPQRALKQKYSKLNISFKKKVKKISFEEGRYKVFCDDGSDYTAPLLVSCLPFPQLLDLDGITRFIDKDKLPRFDYQGDFYVLGPRFHGDRKYFEGMNCEKFSTQENSFRASWNAQDVAGFYELGPEEILRNLIGENEEHKVEDFHPHRWRYSRCVNPKNEPFCSPAKGFFLVGDGFAKGNLQGAIQSAFELLDEKEFSGILQR